MFRPYILRKKVLVGLAIFNVMLVYISFFSNKVIYTDDYEEKINAAKLMRSVLDLTYSFNEKKSNLDTDPFKSGVIGLETSPITTKPGFIKSKQSTTNPNFAALVVELFNDVGISGGDTIAVSFTGSFPGANIALLSACKIKNVHPVIISSIGSSSYGLNTLAMTWIDIEEYLNKKEMFDYMSMAVSLGGDNDRAEELSSDLVSLMKNRIIKSKQLIYHDDIRHSIKERLKIYNDVMDIDEYSAYVSIGGGAVSLGDSIESRLYQPGIIEDISIEDISKNISDYDEDVDEEQEEDIAFLNNDIDESELYTSLVSAFLSKDISVVNLRNIYTLCDLYGLPYGYGKSYSVGEGDVYYTKERHHPMIVFICAIFSIISIIFIGYKSYEQINKSEARENV